MIKINIENVRAVRLQYQNAAKELGPNHRLTRDLKARFSALYQKWLKQVEDTLKY